MVRVNLPASGTETLHLMEMSVHTASVNPASGEVNEEVSVPSSTRAISLFIQDQLAGKTVQLPPSKYHCANEQDALSLRNYQIQHHQTLRALRVQLRRQYQSPSATVYNFSFRVRAVF